MSVALPSLDPAACRSLQDILRWRAEHEPDTVAYVFLRDGETEPERLTYAALDAKARAAAALLQRRHAPGQRALLVYPPGLEFIVAFFGCLYAGVSAVAAYPPGRHQLADQQLRRLRAMTRDAGPALVLASTAVRSRVDRLLPELPDLQRLEWIAQDELESAPAAGYRAPPVGQDDIAFLQYTSGSTHAPKGVMISHRALLDQLELYRQRAGDQWRQSIMAGWLPHYHDFGLVGFILSAAYMGVPYYFMAPASFLRQPVRWLEAISQFHATYSGAPNFAYDLCARKIDPALCQGLDLRSWDIASIGSDPINPTTLERFVAAFKPFGFNPEALLPTYGLAEAVLCVSARRAMLAKSFDAEALLEHRVEPVADGAPGSRRLVSCGATLPGQEVIVVDPDIGAICPLGRAGELWIRGKSIAAGYWQRPEETAGTFGAYLAGGQGPFLRTGDLGFIDAGQIFITGRIKDLIVVRGRNHCPQDIELSAQEAHPALRRGCGAAFLVEVAGEERLVLVQELERGYRSDPAGIFAAVRRAIAEAHGLGVYAIELIAPLSLPKTTSGKIRRGDCRTAFLGGSLKTVARHVFDEPAMDHSSSNELSAPGNRAAPGAPIEQRLSGIWSEALAIPRVGAHDDFFALGGDSLAAHVILAGIQRAFDVDLPLRSLLDHPTVAQLAEQIQALRISRAHAAQLNEAPPSAGTAGLSGPAPATPREIGQPDANLVAVERVMLGQLEALSQLISGQLALLRDAGALGADGQQGAAPAIGRLAAELIGQQRALLHDIGAYSANGRHDAAIAANGSGAPAADRAAGVSRLSDAQVEIQSLSELNPAGAAAFNVMSVLRMREPPDMAALREAFREVARRHEALRTVVEPDGQHQRVLPALEPQLPLVELPDPQPGEAERQTIEWLRDERRRPFDLHHGPLWRAQVLKTAGQHLLAVTAHHLIVDGRSFHVLLDEVAAFYAAACRGEARTISPPMQFGEFLRIRRLRREAGTMAAHEAYWREQLGADLPVLELPADRPHPHTVAYDGACWSIAIGPELRGAVGDLAQRNRCTLFMALLAGFSALLHRLSGQGEYLMGIDTAARAFGGAQRVIGNCTLLVPIISRAAGNPTVAEHLATVRETLLGAFEHQEYTLAMLLDQLNVPLDPRRPSKITATFNFQHWPSYDGVFAPALDLQARTIAYSPFDLQLDATDLGDAIRLDFIYNTALFDQTTVARIAEYYRNMLDRMAAEPEQAIFSLSFLPEAERRKLLVEWNNLGDVASAEISFQQLFEAQVEASPDALAVACAEQQLTYRTLDARANRLAWHLIERGAGPGTIVALLANRGSDYLAALLAILKSGGVYLPLDPGDPDERLRQTLERSGAALVVAGGELLPHLAQVVQGTAAARRPRLVRMAEGFRHGRDDRPPPGAPQQPAYVIYTSGSTGAPKGALIAQSGMLNHLQAKVSTLGLSARDIVAQTASQRFDISVWQFLAPLLAGGSVRVFGDIESHNPAWMLRQIEQQAVTIVETVPAMLRALLDEETRRDAGRPRLRALRWMIPTGEALPPELCRRWISFYPSIPLLNAYGPTECSDDVAQYRIDWPPEPSVARVPIGRPVPGAALYVLDARRELAPIGTTGELYVGGICVGLGYLNDPASTAERFVPNPFLKDEGRRMKDEEPPFILHPSSFRLYRTGDLARYRADGNLEFLGRIDQQEKIQGIRIEPGEIADVLLQHPAVRECVVMARGQAAGDPFLAAYVVLRGGASLSGGELRYFLRRRLPQYMVPATITTLDALPLNANGKLDRAALPDPAPARPGIERAPAAPRTPVEQRLAAIWAGVLKHDRIGIHDDLFELGGRSLDVVQIAARIRDVFHIDMPVSQIYREPTVAEIARSVEAALA